MSGLTAPECHHPHARLMIPAQDYIRALRIRGKVARIADDVMAGYDAVVGPTRPVTATPIDQDFRGVVAGTARDTMGAVGNSAGLPAISVPSGFSDEGCQPECSSWGGRTMRIAYWLWRGRISQ